MVQPFLRRQKAVLLLDPIFREGVVEPHTLVGERQRRGQGKEEREAKMSGLVFMDFSE